MSVQTSLFDHSERRDLGFGAWIEIRSGWLDDVAADTLFTELTDAVPWRAERRKMYDRVLDVPRLVSFCDLTVSPPPHPAVARLRRRLNDIYAGELGEPFTSAGFCLYRDGTDSVAWHGDTIGRSSTEDTMVAIVSLGATRMFAMRPRGGGASLRADDAAEGRGGGGARKSALRADDAAEGRGGGGARKSALRLPQCHGDLLVMGGSCQRTWEHAVPKTSAPVGPRMSIQFRPRNVR